MFKVLVIAYYYPPLGLSGVQRTLKFTKYLKDFNWEPTVLTTADTGYFAFDYSMLKEAENANVRIIRTEGKELNSFFRKKGTVKVPTEFLRKIFSLVSKSIFIPDNKVGWAKKALVTARELLQKEKFNVIFVTAPPYSAINLAVQLKEEFDIPLVIDYRDLWVDHHLAFHPTPVHKYLHKRMEYKALKAADKIIAINRKMKEMIINRYQFLTFDDIFIIPQGFDKEDFQDLKVEEKHNNKLKLTHAGFFYENVSPKYLLRAFKQISVSNPEIASNIELHFIGIIKKENKRLIKKLKLQEFVKEHGYVEHRQTLSKLMSSDVLWAMIGKSKNAAICSSGKIFEYFGTRKPILLLAPDSAALQAVQEYGAGFIVDPYDVEEIRKAILTIYDLYKKGEFPKPNEEFVERHRRDHLSDQLAKQFQFIAKVEV